MPEYDQDWMKLSSGGAINLTFNVKISLSPSIFKNILCNDKNFI